MSKHSTTDLPGRIRWLMAATGMGAVELSALSRVARPTIYYTLYTGKKLSLVNLQRLAETFGVSLDWLIYGTGPAPDLASVVSRIAERRLQAA